MHCVQENSTILQIYSKILLKVCKQSFFKFYTFFVAGFAEVYAEENQKLCLHGPEMRHQHIYQKASARNTKAKIKIALSTSIFILILSDYFFDSSLFQQLTSLFEQL